MKKLLVVLFILSFVLPLSIAHAEDDSRLWGVNNKLWNSNDTYMSGHPSYNPNYYDSRTNHNSYMSGHPSYNPNYYGNSQDNRNSTPYSSTPGIRWESVR